MKKKKKFNLTRDELIDLKRTRVHIDGIKIIS